MPLHLHLGPRTDVLADGLARLLAEPLDDPFAEELVVVPARGVERWLTQRLSHRLGAGPGRQDGVCAGVRFLHPRSLVAELAGVGSDDPWDPDRMVWDLLAVLDASAGDPDLAPLARHVGLVEEVVAGGGPKDVDTESRRALRRDRRHGVLRRVAGLFADYAVQRPALLGAWSAGEDTDGAGAPLPEDLRWQAVLWRRLLERRGGPGPEQRHRDVLARIRAGESLALPHRLSLFGHTRIPSAELEMIDAVGAVREVHLWVPQASPESWRRLAEGREGGSAPVARRRRDDRSALRVRHPLVASLGHDGRELQHRLGTLAISSVHEHPVPGGTLGGTARSDTLLGWLQEDVRQDRLPSPTTDAGRRLDRGDRSVQIHSCHGAMRQVEVLRDALVGLMEDHPDLEPRDVVVMCPDIEAYAPLFAAVFGPSDLPGEDEVSEAPAPHPGTRLRLRLADRGLGSTNPLLALAHRLVLLAGGRATAEEVLDVAATGPVRRRFALDDDDLSTITAWVRGTGVRWGLDAGARAEFGLGAFGQNTWAAGLDRLLLGLATPERGSGRDVDAIDAVPWDDMGSGDLDLAGRLAECLTRIETCREALRSARSPRQWWTALTEGVRSLGEVSPRDAWQSASLERELTALLGHGATGVGDGHPDAVTLSLAEVRGMLERRLEPRPTRSNFRTGHLTVCTMVPMRSVPHRVVCLVGLDDGAFPRGAVPDGDDVLARDPLVGERNPRAEDRQLLLDAVLAATETLVVTYTGNTETTNQARPPAVPLGELIDAVSRTVPSEPAEMVRAHVVRSHPLQPFAPAEFRAAAPFSFDRAGLAGAEAARRDKKTPPRLRDVAVTAAAPVEIALQDLRRALTQPARSFLRDLVDVAAPDDRIEVLDTLPLELDGLQEWGVGQRLLDGLLAALPEGGSDEVDLDALLEEAWQDAVRQERRRGEVPPAALGDRFLEQTVRPRVLAVTRAALRWRTSAGERRSGDVVVPLGTGTRISGVVPDLREKGILRAQYGTPRAHHRLALWIDLLVLAASHGPQGPLRRAVLVGRQRQQAEEVVLQVAPVRAHEILVDLVGLLDLGRAGLLPLPPKTTYAFAEARATRQSDDNTRTGAPARSRSEWEGFFNPRTSRRIEGERVEAAHALLYGKESLVEDLRLPHAGRPEVTLPALAERLWAGYFEGEVH